MHLYDETAALTALNALNYELLLSSYIMVHFEYIFEYFLFFTKWADLGSEMIVRAVNRFN
jgi:hypothetical protein